MAYDFSKHNRTGKEYKNLEGLYNDDPNLIYPVIGLYITTTKKGDHPVVQSEDYNINLPKHLTQPVSEMLSNPECMAAIRAGECGIQIYSYELPEDYPGEIFYSCKFVNI